MGHTWSEIGQFNEPADIAFDPVSGDVFVSDLKNNRIQKFDSNGNYLISWGMPGTILDNSSICNLAVDPKTQFVYVSDIENSRSRSLIKMAVTFQSGGHWELATVSSTIQET